MVSCCRGRCLEARWSCCCSARRSWWRPRPARPASKPGHPPAEREREEEQQQGEGERGRGRQHASACVHGRGRLQRQRISEATQELDDGGYGDEPDGGRGKSVKGLTEVLDDDLGRSGWSGRSDVTRWTREAEVGEDDDGDDTVQLRSIENP